MLSFSVLEIYATQRLRINTSGGQTTPPLLDSAKHVMCSLLRLLKLPKGPLVICAFNPCYDEFLTHDRYTSRHGRPQNHITCCFLGGEPAHPDFISVMFFLINSHLLRPSHPLILPEIYVWIPEYSGKYLVNREQFQGPRSANARALFTLPKPLCVFQSPRPLVGCVGSRFS